MVANKKPCPVCSQKIVVNYKVTSLNVNSFQDTKFLSQFVSASSGSILRRATTGIGYSFSINAKACVQNNNEMWWRQLSKHGILVWFPCFSLILQALCRVFLGIHCCKMSIHNPNEREATCLIFSIHYFSVSRIKYSRGVCVKQRSSWLNVYKQQCEMCGLLWDC